MTAPSCDMEHEKIVAIIDRRVASCKTDIATELHQMNETLTQFSKGFPIDNEGEPDFTGHRRFHDGIIRAAEAQERFWNEMRLDIAKKGAWGLLIIIIGLLIFAIQAKLALIKP